MPEAGGGTRYAYFAEIILQASTPVLICFVNVGAGEALFLDYNNLMAESDHLPRS